MKTIRQKTFETNSSSTHSITMCMESDYNKWKTGELYYLQDNGSFVGEEERNEILKRKVIYERMEFNNGSYTYKDKTVDSYEKQDEFYTKENLDEITQEDIEELLEENFDRYEMPCSYDEYYDDLQYETYEDTFTTPSGDKVVSFGYYGQDY